MFVNHKQRILVLGQDKVSSKGYLG